MENDLQEYEQELLEKSLSLDILASLSSAIENEGLDDRITGGQLVRIRDYLFYYLLKRYRIEKNETNWLLFQYSNALDRGDFETICKILSIAENDAKLENQIVEMNELYQSEMEGIKNENNN